VVERPAELAQRLEGVPVERVSLLLSQHRIGVERVHRVRRRLAGDGVDVVARLVVARVVLLARDAAVDGDLFLRLGHLGAGEQAAARDAAVDEADVVGAAVERLRLRGHATPLEVALEDLLDRARALRAGRAELRAVAVIDEADVVRRRDHVGVDHHVDVVHLTLAEVRGVVLRADQPVLLATEPQEADLVLRMRLGDRLGEVELPRRAGAGPFPRFTP